MLMGDLVLLESEVGPVVDALQRGGIDQTALHNHLVGEMPHVMYLHISGRGRAAALATTVREALARTGTPPAAPAPASQPAFSLDTAQIAQVIGEPTGTTSAATTGDFVLIASEVNPVLRALRANGIQVTALHSHMLNESPRLLFMHFWGEGDALKLARGLRVALDEVNVKRD